MKSTLKPGLLLVGCCLLVAPSLQAQSGLPQRYAFSHRQMGTLFQIILYSPDSMLARQATDAAFHRIDELNDILSDYKPDSELNQLSTTAGTGSTVQVSAHLWKVLEESEKASRLSKGAFDVTVGPYTSLWRRAWRQQALPSNAALTEAKRAVGYSHVKLDRTKKTAQLIVTGMRLDMGGIGKGYAIDEALVILRQYGLTIAMVDGGGNIIVGDAPPGKKGWDIEVGIGEENRMTISLTNAAVSTSGDLYQYLELNGKRYSHLLDPSTGIGLTDQAYVIVIASDGITSDWLSTAVSVLGPKKGLKLINKTKDAAAYFIRSPAGKHQKWQSKRWPPDQTL